MNPTGSVTLQVRGPNHKGYVEQRADYTVPADAPREEVEAEIRRAFAEALEHVLRTDRLYRGERRG